MVSKFAPVLLLATFFLSGCGGGGGGNPSESLSIALSPNPLTASFYQGQLPAPLTVDAVATGNTSASTIYVVIVDAAGTFAPGPTTISQTGTNTYSVALRTATDLSIGSHPGTLQTRVCSDPLCQSVLAIASLPYNITVLAPALYSVFPSSLDTAAIQGGSVGLEADLTGVPSDVTPYVIARDSGETFMVGSAIALEATSSSGRYAFRLPTLATASNTARSGTLGLQFCSDPACRVIYGSSTVPYRVQILSILAGSPNERGNADGPGASARFWQPSSITVDGFGNVYLVDAGNNVVREIDPTGQVSTLPANSRQPGSVAANAAGTLYFSEGINASESDIKKRAPDGTTTLFTTTTDLYRGFGATIAADNSGQVFSIYTDFSRSQPEGVVYRFPSNGSRSEILRGAPLGLPQGLATDASGNLYVSSSSPSRIIKIAGDGSVTTLDTGDVRPSRLAVDGSGVIFVVDAASNRLVRLDPSGATSVLIPDDVRLTNESKVVLTGVALGNDGELFISSDNSVVLRTRLNSPN